MVDAFFMPANSIMFLHNKTIVKLLPFFDRQTDMSSKALSLFPL